MPASWISAGVGLYSAYNANKNSKAGQSSAAAAADPFASQRGVYQDDLRSLMQGEFKPSDPSYQWRFNQGMEGVNRGAAASGLLRSGNRLAELESFGQGQASTEYGNQFSRLSQLAGANIGSPAAASQAISSQQGNSSAYVQQLASKAAPYIQNWWSGLNTGGSGAGSGTVDNTLF